jgi:hypothetical protein
MLQVSIDTVSERNGLQIRPRTALARLILIASAGLVGLACSEGLLHIQETYFHMMARRYNYVALTTSNPIWDHGLRPRLTLASAWAEEVGDPRPLTYSTNDLGCRYPFDLRVPRPVGVRRILVLGDSFTLGYHYEDTVAVQIEHRLNSNSQGARSEVVNCASPSHSPLLYYLRLEHQLADLQPNEVLLNIDLTDVYDDYWRYRPRAVFSANGEPLAVQGPARWRRRLLEWALGRFYLARLAWAVRSSAAPRFGVAQGTPLPTGGRKIFDYYSTLPVTSDAWQREVGFCLENISRILIFCRQRGIAVTVTLVPHKEQLWPGADGRLWNREFDRRVEKLCREVGVDFYSPAEDLAHELNSGHSLYLQNDMHFTVEGARRWAGLVADFSVAQHQARQEPANLAHAPDSVP